MVTKRTIQKDEGTHTVRNTAIAFIATFIIGLIVVFAMRAMNPAPATETAEQAADAQAATQAESLESAEQASGTGEEEADPQTEQSGDAGAASQESSQAASASSAAAARDLSWRNVDFAVDPSRRTAWNLDGTDEKTVYLTIDDGPSENTREVLDILDRYDCKATFFVVGHDSDYYPLIKEAYDSGHTIGLHSDTHDYAQIYSSEDAFFADLDAIGQVVKDQIGYVPCFIRFPGGSSNAISADYSSGIMSKLVNSVQERGYQYYDWNLSVGDGDVHTADEIVAFATAPTDLTNIVILCHDSATKQTTVEALPRIIEHYQSLGYTFKAIDRKSFVCHHAVSN